MDGPQEFPQPPQGARRRTIALDDEAKADAHAHRLGAFYLDEATGGHGGWDMSRHHAHVPA
jgi:hypothetical protein